MLWLLPLYLWDLESPVVAQESQVTQPICAESECCKTHSLTPERHKIGKSLQKKKCSFFSTPRTILESDVFSQPTSFIQRLWIHSHCQILVAYFINYYYYYFVFLSVPSLLPCHTSILLSYLFLWDYIH